MAKKKKEAEEEKPEESSDGSIAVNDAWTGLLAISLLALMVGAGFLAYDYMQYYGEELPKVPKLTGALPKTPPQEKAPPKVEPKEEKKDDKKEEKKIP